MSVTNRRLLAVATALLILGGVGVPVPASAESTTAPAGVQACAPSDLSLREAPPADADDSAPGTAFVLRNHGLTACRITGGGGIRLLDASGNAIPLRFAPRTKMAMLLTLDPGAEASFTVSFAPHDLVRCAVAARIEVTIPGLPTAVSAPTTIVACGDAVVTVSNLRLGAPAAVVPPHFLP
jgi:hypothetical protein